jgi:hypothetical protein
MSCYIFSRLLRKSFIPLRQDNKNHLKGKLKHSPISFQSGIAYLPKPYPSYNGTSLLSLQDNITNTPFITKQIQGAMHLHANAPVPHIGRTNISTPSTSTPSTSQLLRSTSALSLLQPYYYYYYYHYYYHNYNHHDTQLQLNSTINSTQLNSTSNATQL